MRLFLGVDQGHTKTAAAFADENGDLIAAGYAAGACHARDGLEQAMRCVGDAVQQAAGRERVSLDGLTGACFALAGADWPDEYDLLRQAVRVFSWLPASYSVVNDCISAFRAGAGKPYGVVVCVGTGTNAAGIGKDGSQYIFGYYAMDIGGRWVGEQALHKVFRAEDGRGQKTRLTQILLNRYHLENVDQLLRLWVENRLPESPKHLCPIVFEAARQGEPASVAILRDLGEKLVEFAVALIKRFGFQQEAVEVVLSGGVLKGQSNYLMDVIRAGIHAVAQQAMVFQAPLEPVAGAAILAMEGAGVPFTKPRRQTMLRSAKEIGLLRID